MELGIFLAAGIFTALLLLWLRPRSRQLKTIFSETHLIEIAEQMEAIKPLAVRLADVGEEPFALEDDPRAFVTRGGIVVYYTITRDGDSYRHHYSLKDQYGITGAAVGATLVVYIAQLLGAAPETLTIERSEQQVYHAAFDLSASDQQVFNGAALRVPTAREARALLEACREARQTLDIRKI